MEEGKYFNEGENACLFINVNVKFPRVLDTQRILAIELIFSLKIF